MKRKGDLILILCIILLAGGIWLFTNNQATVENGYLEVSRNGEIVGEYPLEADASFLVTAADGTFNKVVIAGGEVYMEDADCPDRLCVKHKKINRSGESILCLPHKLSLQVKKGKESDLDGIAY